LTPTAVFDLDGTLLAGDSTAAWLRARVASSWLRGLVALVTLPGWLFLLGIPATRGRGASILIWIATVGLDQQNLVDSIEAFATRFERGDGGIRWRSDGLKTMHHHLAAGDRVVVVTAAPEWLAQRLLNSRAGVGVLGSTLARRCGGWVIGHHCFGEEKCRRLEQSGYGSAWECAYTDSSDDAPLLAAASKCGFLINPRAGVIARLQARGQSHVSAIRWA
jgi:phosphatidylglycerophosphatase C